MESFKIVNGRTNAESYPADKSQSRRSRSRGEAKPSEDGGGGDTFWDSKWEGMQLDEKLSKAEYKGRYYLNTNKRFHDATGDLGEKGDGTPSLSPSPERVDKSKEAELKNSDSDSDTEEFKRLKEMKKVADFSDLSINKRLDYVTETHNINSLSI